MKEYLSTTRDEFAEGRQAKGKDCFFHTRYLGCHQKVPPRFRVGLSASNNLIKRIPHKFTQYFVFSWLHLQSSWQTRLAVTLRHPYFPPSQFLLEMSPCPPQLTVNAISSYKCLILSVSQSLDTLLCLLVSVLLVHHPAVYSTALHGPSPKVPGNRRSVRWRELAMRLHEVFLPFAATPLHLPTFVDVYPTALPF